MKARVQWKKVKVWLFGVPLLVLMVGFGLSLVRQRSAAVMPQLLLKTEGVTSLASFSLSPDGKQFAGGFSNGSVQVWDVESKTLNFTLRGHRGWINSVVFSADGKYVASGGVHSVNRRILGGEVNLWDARTGALIWACYLPQPINHVQYMAFSPDGTRLAVGMNAGNIRILDAINGKPLRTLPGNKGIWCLAFSPDSKLLASNAKLWDLATGRALRTLGRYEEIAAFSPDGRTLAVSKSNGRIELQDVKRGTVKRVIQVPEVRSAHVVPIAFTQDGSLIGNYLSSIFLWDCATGKLLLRVNKPQPCLSDGGVISSDGKTLAALPLHTKPRGIYVWRFRH